MDSVSVIRWVAVGLHGIVLAFGLFVVVVLVNGDLLAAISLADTDSALKQALLISLLVIGGNALGIVMLLTPLFKSFLGICLLLGYEIVFLAASLVFLSLDYSLVIGIIVVGLLYVAGVRKKAYSKTST